MWEIYNPNYGTHCRKRIFSIEHLYNELKSKNFNTTDVMKHTETFTRLLAMFENELNYSVNFLGKGNYPYKDELLFVGNRFTKVLKYVKSRELNIEHITKTIANLLRKIEHDKFIDCPYDEIKREIGSLTGHLKKLRLRKDAMAAYRTSSYLSDYDRLILSSSFRRLQEKTQVFPLEKYDYVRTRLTHSHEVSSLAEQLGQKFDQLLLRKVSSTKKYHNSKRLQKLLNEQGQDSASILKTAALLHDIGNPPFGHYGESIIREYFCENWNTLEVRNHNTSSLQKCDTHEKTYKATKLADVFNKNNSNHNQMIADLTKFDGNAQGFRVATKLQQHQMSTLDLTHAVLSASIKYPKTSSQSINGKFSYFYSEEDVINEMKAMGTFSSDNRSPLAMLLEAADDICNLTTDFDDAVKKGAIQYEHILIKQENLQNDEYFKNVPQSNYVDKDKRVKICRKFFDDLIRYYKENRDQGIKDPLEHTVRRKTIELRSELQRAVIQHFDNITCLDNAEHKEHNSCANSKIRLLIQTNPLRIMLIPSKDNSSEKEHENVIELLNETEYGLLIQEIKSMYREYLYSYKPIVRNELEGREIMLFLLDQFVKSVLNLDDDYSLDNSHKPFVGNENSGVISAHKKIYSLISSNFVYTYLTTLDKVPNDKESRAERIYYRLRLVIDYISGMTDTYAKTLYLTLKGHNA